MARFCKKKARPWVDLILAFGWQSIRFPGGPEIDYQFIVGCILNIERIEARHTLRTYHAIQQSFQRVPDFRLFAASVDDPLLANHLYRREKDLAAAEDREQRNGEVD